MKRIQLDQALEHLMTQLLHMSALVDTMLTQTLEALSTQNQDLAAAAICADTPIDEAQGALQEAALSVMLSQQPLFERDLRLLTSIVPMTTDLERIADEAEALAQLILRLQPLLPQASVLSAEGNMGSREPKTLEPGTSAQRGEASEQAMRRALTQLGQEAYQIYEATMRALVARDPEAARHLWQKRPAFKQRSYVVRQAIQEALTGTPALVALAHDAHSLQRTMYLFWMTHPLERIVDHCTNLCERIVYIVQGQLDVQTVEDEDDGRSWDLG